MGNIITAIINLINNPVFTLDYSVSSNNRMNNMGEALELYVKDLFCGSLLEPDKTKRNELLKETFSYLGNQNNPPDAILKNGDAIEIKKIESNNSALALNSSYPKSKLFVDNPMLNKACRDCEDWKEKDIIYSVGVVNNKKIRSLAFVYGTEYCADKEVYERIKNTIKNGICEIEDIEFSETRELGHVNRVDPLGITYLRVRGMWGIENPFVSFKYLFERDFSKDFNFMGIISCDKFYSFDNCGDLLSLTAKNKSLKIVDVEVKSPNNPAKFIKSKLISFVL